MKKTIWKFELEITDTQFVEMPKGSHILSVGNQEGHLCLWAFVNPSAEKEKRTFEIVGTGNPVHWGVSADRRFIGTVIMPPFVWHIFESVGL